MKQEERNRRNDLYVLANSYSGRLKAIRPNLMPETEFHIVPKRPPVSKVVNGTADTAGGEQKGGDITDTRGKVKKLKSNYLISVPNFRLKGGTVSLSPFG